MKRAIAATATVAVALVTLMAISAFAVAPAAASQADSATFTLLSPVADRNVFYGGSVMPVKFTLTDANGSFITDAKATITVTPGPTTPAGQKNGGTDMFVVDGHTYTYKLDTKPLAAGPGSGTHDISIHIVFADGSTLDPPPITGIALH